MIKKKSAHMGMMCPKCKERLFSLHRHDFVMCGCSNGTFVDGGYDYLRYGGKAAPIRIKWDKKLDEK